MVCAMITAINFKVKGEERKKLAYAIGELLGMPVKYTRTPKFDYLIGRCILDKNGVFHASEDMTEILLQCDKIGNESKDITVPHGAFGYISHNECVHAYRIR